MVNVEANSLLKISQSEDFTKFLHNCVDDLINKKQDVFDNYSNDIEWIKQEHEAAMHLIQDIFCSNVKSNNENVQTKITNLGEQANHTINNCYMIRKPEIAQHLFKQNLIKGGHSLVHNIDWKLKWVLGSSKLASLSEPILQMDFTCLNSISGAKIINFEINLEQVEKLISDLEEVKANLK